LHVHPDEETLGTTPLRCQFAPDGSLSIRTYKRHDGVIPDGPFHALEFTSFNQAIRVRDPQDLKGKVLIDSPEAAKWFVRLLTSPELAITHRSLYLELLLPAEFDDRLYYYGPRERYMLPKKAGDCGEITPSWAKKFGWTPIRVDKTSSGWIVTRWLVDTGHPPFNKVEIVQEDVSTTGGYTRKTISTPPVKGHDLNIFYMFVPMLM